MDQESFDQEKTMIKKLKIKNLGALDVMIGEKKNKIVK